MNADVYFLAILATASVATDLPVRQVVLYKHGVGYFERSGQLGPGASARLDFKATEMNDILKSLTIVEKGGGKVSGLRYDSSEPLENKLAEFPFRLGEKQPLSAVLDQLKGARLEIKFGTETVVGSIVGGRTVGGDEKQPEREQITLLLDSGELRNFDLAAAASIKFIDLTLQGQLKDYLTTLVQSRSKERRSVYIDSTGTKSRQLFASYMIPMPVWKSSYRLIFDASAQPTFEGWAIVDNTTGEDWTDVQLSLVSGRPISFVSRLYEPRYIQRPAAELAEEQAQAPVVHEGAVDIKGTMIIPPGIGGGSAGGVGAGISRPAGERAAKRETAEDRERLMVVPSSPASSDLADAARAKAEVASSVAATAAARELGELFEYRIAMPVTVRKGESAMLPFLQQKASARKLLIYTGEGSAHPMNAVEITNDTGKTLDGGPLTVFDVGAYAGEALMETLKNGDKRLVSYAVDLGTRITTQFDSRSDPVRAIKLQRGVLTTRTAVVETKTYTIRNVDPKAKTLILEHPARPHYKLLNQKPSETTSKAYRFEVKLAAGATEKFAITEERLEETSYMVVNFSPDVLYTYVQNKNLSAAARNQLQQVVDQQRQIAATAEELRRAESDINTLVRDQDRIRQNINSLNAVSGQQQQVQTYARQLATQESQLAALRDRLSELQRKRTALESDLKTMIDKMEF